MFRICFLSSGKIYNCLLKTEKLVFSIGSKFQNLESTNTQKKSALNISALLFLLDQYFQLKYSFLDTYSQILTRRIGMS